MKKLFITAVLIFYSISAYAEIDTSHRGYNIVAPGDNTTKQSAGNVNKGRYDRFHNNTVIYATFGNFKGNSFSYRDVEYGKHSGDSASIGFRKPIARYFAIQWELGFRETESDTKYNQKTAGDKCTAKYNTFPISISLVARLPYKAVEPYIYGGVAFNVNNLKYTYTDASNVDTVEQTGGSAVGAIIGAGLRTNIAYDLVFGISVDKSYNLQKLKDKIKASDYGGTNISFHVGTVF